MYGYHSRAGYSGARTVGMYTQVLDNYQLTKAFEFISVLHAHKEACAEVPLT